MAAILSACAWLALGAACHGNQRGASGVGGRRCPGDEVAECIARYAKPELDGSDVRRWLEEGLADCFDAKDPERLERQGACLPLTVGRDKRNRRTLEVAYTCADVCPNYGMIVTRYAGVERADCCAAGGVPNDRGTWSAYLGCSPIEHRLPGAPCAPPRAH